MKTITIEGKFTGSVNNFVILDIFRPNGLTNPYNSTKTFYGNFKQVEKYLEPDSSYTIDLSGFTTGCFELRISGEFQNPNPILDSFHADSFNPGYFIHTHL